MICLDASEWKSEEDFYSAILPQLQAPAWHGHNLNALYDSLSGGINGLEPPFEVIVTNAANVTAELKVFLGQVSETFGDARKAFGSQVWFELCSVY